MFLIVITAGCSIQASKSETSVSSTSATSSLIQIPSAKFSNEIMQPKSFASIDMTTNDSGYAITKDFHVLKTSNHFGDWINILTLTNSVGYTYKPALFVLDNKTVFIATFTVSGIEVEKSINAGESWSKSEIKMQIDNANSGYGGGMTLSFINRFEGFLFTGGDAACGLMSKALYRTTDGGNSWSLVNNWDLGGNSLISSHKVRNEAGIHGYPTGTAFSNADIGYITCTYHGQTEISVYKTVDGGKDWSVASLPIPQKYTSLAGKGGNYVDAYPPVFFGKDNDNAKMELLFVHNDAVNNVSERYAYIYSSDNSGATWHIDGISNMLMYNYCFIDDKNGFGLDENGMLYTTKNGGITWSDVS